MYISLVETCSDYGLASILKIVQTALSLMQIIIPIIAIVALIKIFTQLMVNPDNKKLHNGIRNWLISLLVFFFLPIIINVVMGMLDDQFSLSQCWNYAKNNSTIQQDSQNSSDDDYYNNRKPLLKD